MAFNRMQPGDDAYDWAAAAESERLSIRSSIRESGYVDAVADDLHLSAADPHRLGQERPDRSVDAGHHATTVSAKSQERSMPGPTEGKALVLRVNDRHSLEHAWHQRMNQLMEVVAMDNVRTEFDHRGLNRASRLEERRLVATGTPSSSAEVFKFLSQRTWQINADYAMAVVRKSLDNGPGEKL
jgi:tRNA A37 N6-isopentenylltransferase MiaA